MQVPYILTLCRSNMAGGGRCHAPSHHHMVLSLTRISAVHINPSAETASVSGVNKCASGVNAGSGMRWSQCPAGCPSLETPSGC